MQPSSSGERKSDLDRPMSVLLELVSFSQTLVKAELLNAMKEEANKSVVKKVSIFLMVYQHSHMAD